VCGLLLGWRVVGDLGEVSVVVCELELDAFLLVVALEKRVHLGEKNAHRLDGAERRGRKAGQGHETLYLLDLDEACARGLILHPAQTDGKGQRKRGVDEQKGGRRLVLQAGN